MKQEDIDYGAEHGYSPEAENVVCIDFDQTITPWGPLFQPDVPPLPGAAEAIRALKAAGYNIVIFTSRLSSKWLIASGEHKWTQIAYITDYLLANDIPFSYITAEKVPALVYIDDRAMLPDWQLVRERFGCA